MTTSGSCCIPCCVRIYLDLKSSFMPMASCLPLPQQSVTMTRLFIDGNYTAPLLLSRDSNQQLNDEERPQGTRPI